MNVLMRVSLSRSFALREVKIGMRIAGTREYKHTHFGILSSTDCTACACAPAPNYTELGRTEPNRSVSACARHIVVVPRFSPLRRATSASYACRPLPYTASAHALAVSERAREKEKERERERESEKQKKICAIPSRRKVG